MYLANCLESHNQNLKDLTQQLSIICKMLQNVIHYAHLNYCGLLNHHLCNTFGKAVANGPVGQVLAGPLFLKVKAKFHFTKSN